MAPGAVKTSGFKKILLKLSGEALMGNDSYGINTSILVRIATEVREVVQSGVQLSVVIGGGNIFRGVKGATEMGMDRASADYMGMLATCINSMALQDAFERQGVQTRVMSAIKMEQISEPYIRRRAVRHLEKGRVVIFAAGTGNPYFTTDTAASLRAMEIGAEVILKGTKVNGIYDSDPNKNKAAKRYRTVSYRETLDKNLQVMDATAVAMCMDNKLPIIVFDMTKPGNIALAVTNAQDIGTVVWMGETVFA